MTCSQDLAPLTKWGCMTPEVLASASSRVGLVYNHKVIRPSQYFLHVGDHVVCATYGPMKFITSKTSHQWRWFDGRECRVENKDLFAKRSLFIDDVLTYEMPGAPIHLGLSWFSALTLKELRCEWRGVQDSSPAVVVDTHFCTHGAYNTFKFVNVDEELIGVFEQYDHYRLKFGKTSPMPIQNFTGSLEELLLVWAFIVSMDNNSSR